MLAGKRILLIIGGGIAAYKSLDLIRRLRERGAAVTPVLTRAAEEFVTPLSASALAAEKAYRHLFDLTDEAEMGHIQLSRAAHLIVVAPATADLMAKMAHGHADDLASTLLLATDQRILVAPAMNVRMWQHPATQRNIAQLRSDGVMFVGPNEGDMACGEYGPGRMAEPLEIVGAVEAALTGGPLKGRHILVTSGPTHEPIDPVRYIANRSSGAQGTALAAALRDLGARVTFITGPATVPAPQGVRVLRVETASQMADAVKAALPADVAVMVAAVADWRTTEVRGEKMKKRGSAPPALRLTENPDILATVSVSEKRPRLVVGFAAETEKVIEHAKEKRKRKGADWIVANDVSGDVMGGDVNLVHIVTAKAVEMLPEMAKDQVAQALVERIADALVGERADT